MCFTRDGQNNVVIYAVTSDPVPNKIVTVTDIDANSVFSVLLTADPNKVYRGIKFAPVAASGPVTVPPSSFSVFRGVLESGGLAELAASDDQYMIIRNGITALRTESPITLIVDGTSPNQTVSDLKFVLENHVSITGLTQRLDLFDFVAGSYENQDTRSATTTDSVVTVTATTPNRFIETGTMDMRERTRIRADGPVFTNTWRSLFDQTVWVVTP